MKHKVYVASSWRNEYYTDVVRSLVEAGHSVYDFRNPPSGGHGFKWSEIDADFTQWTPEQCREGLSHPLAVKQFRNDEQAMADCDTCIMVLPCGRSAHTEAGWFAGKGRRVIVLLPTKQEPELMYGLFDKVCVNISEVLLALEED